MTPDAAVRMKWRSCSFTMISFLIERDFIFLAISSTLLKLLLRVFRRGHGVFTCFALDFFDVSVCLFIAEDQRGGSCL